MTVITATIPASKWPGWEGAGRSGRHSPLLRPRGESVKSAPRPTDDIGTSEGVRVPGWEGGFTLIETVVVLAIVAALMVIGLVSYSRYTHLADNAAVQLDLLTAVKVQALTHLEQGQFTTDAAALRSLEPNLEYSGDGLD